MSRASPLPEDARIARPRVAAETLPLAERVGAFALLLAAEFLYGWAWSTVDVLRPQLRAAAGASLSEVGLLYTVQAGGALIGAIVLGQLGDRFGRRNVLGGVLAAFGALLIAGVFVNDYVALLAQRFALGLALGGVQPLVSSLYLGLFPPRMCGKLASAVNAVFTLSGVGLGFALGALGPRDDWRLLLWIGGGAAIALAPLMLLLLRDDRSIRGHGRVDEPVAAPRAPIGELLAPDLRRLTLIVAVMAGCNYFAAQAFGGWTSTFLAEDRGFPPADVGAIIAWQFSGSLIGGFFWGWFGDRFGRKAGALGYVAGAALMAVYLLAIGTVDAFRWVAFLVGFAIAANVVWPPWVAELFPERLRASALSVFNWGRIVSLTAPIATGAIAESVSLTAAMLLAPPALLLVVLLWRSLPETVRA